MPGGQWFTDAVTWAAENGVVNGVGSGKFEPDGRVTREQIATILFRYAAKRYDTSARADLSVFPDAGRVSAYAREALAWANAAGLVNGTDNGHGLILDPQGDGDPCTGRRHFDAVCKKYRPLILESDKKL